MVGVRWVCGGLERLHGWCELNWVLEWKWDRVIKVNNAIEELGITIGLDDDPSTCPSWTWFAGSDGAESPDVGADILDVVGFYHGGSVARSLGAVRCFLGGVRLAGSYGQREAWLGRGKGLGRLRLRRLRITCNHEFYYLYNPVCAAVSS